MSDYCDDFERERLRQLDRHERRLGRLLQRRRHRTPYELDPARAADEDELPSEAELEAAINETRREY